MSALLIPAWRPMLSLLRALWIYQSERFPLRAYVPLVTAFAGGCAIHAAWVTTGVAALRPDLLLAVSSVLLIFLLMRIADEFKDAETDARYRPERPVPRGLVTLGQLGGLAITVVAALVAANAVWAPRALPWLFAALGYLALMTAEFGVGAWLRERLMVYAASHMVILVLIAGYASSFGAPGATVELWPLLALAYCNGFVLEIGRKTRGPAFEAPGVETYSQRYGVRAASVLWSVFVVLALAALAAGVAAGRLFVPASVTAGVAAAAVLVTAWRRVERIEGASGVWLMASYLIVAAAPFVEAQLLIQQELTRP